MTNATLRNLLGKCKPQLGTILAGLSYLITACSTRHGATAPVQIQRAAEAAPVAPRPTEVGADLRLDASTDDPRPDAATDAGNTPQPKEPSPEFELREKTTIWSVIGKTCERILFNPSTPLAGTAFIRGQSFDYRISGNQLDLRTFYFFTEKGLFRRDCRTAFLVGPGFATLGGANVYATESECRAASRKAIVLDDSPAITRKSRCGVPAPVVADQAQCDAKCFGYCPTTPGCISVLRSVWSRESRRK